jgi:RNA polymerase sigma-70 factor (ECF subfamily)
VTEPLFARLFQEHFPFVWRCLRGLGVCDADLDDMTQEVFVVVHRRLADLQPERGVRPWLYGILRLVAQNHRRSRRRSAERQQSLGIEPQAPPAGPLESLQAREAARVVGALLEQLEVNRREVFLLVELEELSVPEVASTLRIPVNTAYSRLRLARADFKAALLRRGCP